MPDETPLPAARFEDTVEWAVCVLAEQVSANGPLAPQAIDVMLNRTGRFYDASLATSAISSTTTPTPMLP